MDDTPSLPTRGDTPPGNQNHPKYPAQDRANPDCLEAIYKLLVAMAKHDSVQIPPELLLPTRTRNVICAAESDPKGRQYDNIKTIDYQRQQLPTESDHPSRAWQEAFSPFNLSWPSFARRDGRAKAGLTNVLVWKTDNDARQNGAFVDYNEFGYDESGYVCMLGLQKEPGVGGATGGPPRGGLPAASISTPPYSGSDFHEHIQLTTNTRHTSPTPWVGQRFGREWKFRLNGVRDGKLLSIAALQVCPDADSEGTSENGSVDSPRRRLAQCFLMKFKGKWGMELSRDLWGSSDYRWTHSTMFDKSSWEDLVFQYHMRVLTTNPRPRLLGPGLVRSSGELAYGENPDTLRMVELRYSVGLKTTWRLDYPVFTLITMTDSAASCVQKLGQLSNANEWGMAGIHPSRRGAGIAAFAFRIQSLFREWESHWSTFLDDIGKALNSDVDTILSSSGRRKFMVDGSDLRLSEFYFAIIQTLRIAADWIQESIDDLRCTVADIDRLYFSPTSINDCATFLPSDANGRDIEIQTFKQNWESVMLRQQRIGAALLSRIAKKQEETKSLRDGLFNATSVNEATKSTQLNHYILAFTVVTVIYLPLSFTTALFALGFFDLKDQRQITWFIATIISVACATYLFSWLWIRTVQDSAKTQTLPNRFIGLDHGIRLDRIQFRFPKKWKRGRWKE